VSTRAADATATIPAGAWRVDPVHSTIGFSARHMVVNTFRGELGEFTGRVTSDGSEVRLEAAAPVAGITTRDPNLTAHLASPDFLDAERHPEVRFTSTAVRADGDRLTVEGMLAMRGIERPLTLTGSVSGPVEDPFGGVRLGLVLEGTFDRRDFGIDWNAPLPGGGFVLGNEVTLTAQIELVRED
jgi:polyisoprenoid-binding protein YceI